jgi:urocanate hydratase
VLRTDPGIGVIRHADAGYEASLKVLAESDLIAPMVEAAATAGGPSGTKGEPA